MLKSRLMQRALWLSLLTVALAQTAYSEEHLVLENEHLRVALSRSSATLLAVEHKQRNQDYLGSVAQPGWFQVQLPLEHWEGHRASSGELPTIAVRRLAQDAVQFHAEKLISGEGTYPVRFRLTLRLDGENLVARLNLDNQSDETIDRVVFPRLAVPPGADSQEHLHTPNNTWPLRNIFSENDVRVAHNPYHSLDPMDARAWFFSDPRISVKAANYPMFLTAGWVNYVRDGRGIGFDVRDADIQFQRLLVERRLYRDAHDRRANRRDYELSWNWYPLVRPGARWESPEVYINFGESDWLPIARQHREWLTTWIRRPSPPPTFQSSIGWISRNVRSFDQIPEMARQGVEVGAPYFILYGWNQIGAGGMAYGNYPRLKLGGAEALRRNLKTARELGSYPMAWINITLTVETNLGHQQMGKDWVALDRWGGELLGGRWSFYEPFQIVTTPNSDVWIEFDPSTGAKDFMLAIVHRLIHDYGFAGFHMDLGNKTFLSYRPEHERPEVAFSRGYADFYSRAQQIVKGADPNGIIVGENLSLLMNQYVDSTWIFEGGPLNVPMLSRLRYTVPWTTVSARAIPTDRGHASRALVMNALLDIFDDLTAYPEYAAHLKRLHKLKASNTRYFYQGEFSNEDGFALEAADEHVLAKSYRHPAGEFLAVMIANNADAPRHAVLRPDSGLSGRQVHRRSLDGRRDVQPWAPEIRVELAPFDVQIISFEEP